jgi:hypothetical protein
MYLQPSEWSNAGIAPTSGPRSIGSILSAMPEVAALRAAQGLSFAQPCLAPQFGVTLYPLHV